MSCWEQTPIDLYILGGSNAMNWHNNTHEFCLPFPLTVTNLSKSGLHIRDAPKTKSIKNTDYPVLSFKNQFLILWLQPNRFDHNKKAQITLVFFKKYLKFIEKVCKRQKHHKSNVIVLGPMFRGDKKKFKYIRLLNKKLSLALKSKKRFGCTFLNPTITFTNQAKIFRVKDNIHYNRPTTKFLKSLIGMELREKMEKWKQDDSEMTNVAERIYYDCKIHSN